MTTVLRLPPLAPGYYWHPSTMGGDDNQATVEINTIPTRPDERFEDFQIRYAHNIANQFRQGINQGSPTGYSIAPGTNPDMLRAFGAPEDFVQRVQSPEYRSQRQTSQPSNEPLRAAQYRVSSEEAIARELGRPRAELQYAREELERLTAKPLAVKPPATATIEVAPPSIVSDKQVGDGVNRGNMIDLGGGELISRDDWKDIPEKYQLIGLTRGAKAMNEAIEQDNASLKAAINSLRPFSRPVTGEKVEASRGVGFSPIAPDTEYDIVAARKGGVDRGTLNLAFGQDAVDKALESHAISLTDAVDPIPDRPSESDFVASYFQGKGWGEPPSSRGTVRNTEEVGRLTEAQDAYLRKYPVPSLQEYQAAALYDAGVDESVFGSTSTRTATEGELRSISAYGPTLRKATDDYVAKYGVSPIIQQSAQNVLDAATGYKTITDPNAPAWARVGTVVLDLLIIESLLGRPLTSAATKAVKQSFSAETRREIFDYMSAVRQRAAIVAADERGYVSLNPFEQGGKEAFIPTPKGGTQPAKIVPQKPPTVMPTTREEAAALADLRASGMTDEQIANLTRQANRVRLQSVYDQINADLERARSGTPKEITPPKIIQSTPKETLTVKTSTSTDYASLSEQKAWLNKVNRQKQSEDMRWLEQFKKNNLDWREQLKREVASPDFAQKRQVWQNLIRQEVAKIGPESPSKLVAQAHANEARYNAGAAAAITQIKRMSDPNKALIHAANLDSGTLHAVITQAPATFTRAYSKADAITQAQINTKVSGALNPALQNNNAAKAHTLAQAETRAEAAAKALAMVQPQTRGATLAKSATKTEGQTKGSTLAKATTQAKVGTQAKADTNIRPADATKPAQGIRSQPGTPTARATKSPVPTKPPPERGSKPPLITRAKKKAEQEKALIERASQDGALTWKQGKLNGKPMYKLWVYPYDPKDDMITVDHIPKGAHLVNGRFSAYQTAKVLRGKAPAEAKTADIGAFLATVSPTDRTRRKIRLSFTPDPTNKGHRPIRVIPATNLRSLQAGKVYYTPTSGGMILSRRPLGRRRR